MKLNPIFSFLQKVNYREQNFELKTDKENHQYFLKPLETSEDKIEFTDQVWSVSEQHLSCFEFYNDKKPYVTAFHFTMTLTHPDEIGSRKIHCHFNSQSIYKGLSIKEGAEYLKISSVLEAWLKNHAELSALPTFTTIRDSIEKNTDRLRVQTRKEELYIEKLSRNINKNLELYIRRIETLIPLLQEISDLGGYEGTKIKIYQRILGLCYQKQKQTKTEIFTNQMPPSITPTDISPEETLAESKLKESEIIPSLEEKLKIINEEIKKESSNPTKLYELLNKKLDLLPEDGIDELIQTLNQITTNQNVNRETLIEAAMKGDDKAIQQVIDQGVHLTPHHYFWMVSLGNEEFFKKAYERFQINLNILFSDDNGKNYYSYLETAYRKRNFSLFSYLLQIGANPNVTTYDGTRLIHKIANDGEIEYAKNLLESCPQTDISSFSGNNQSTIGISTRSKNKIREYKKTKENIQKYQVDLIEKKEFYTPLMRAIYHGHERMVYFLLESKAEPFFESKKSEINIMELATSCRGFGGKKVKKINPNIILSLIKKGGKVDTLLSTKGCEMTGLYFACQEGDINTVITLVECFSADTNFQPFKENESSFLSGLGYNPLIVVLTKWNDLKYLSIAEFLLDQDFVPIKKSTLNKILEFKTKLGLSPKAVRNIEINREKVNLLIAANQAYNKMDYKTAIDSAREGLFLKTDKYKTEQHNECLSKVLYLSYRALQDFPNALLICEMYMSFLKNKLEKNLDPNIHINLQTSLTKAEDDYKTISFNNPFKTTILIWQSSSDKEKRENPCLQLFKK